MSLAAAPTLLVIAYSIGGIVCLAALALAARFFWLVLQERRSRTAGGVAAMRHCRYCHWGKAFMKEETARVEGDDLVEVRCYVCTSCGLPQWSVERSPVVQVAS